MHLNVSVTLPCNVYGICFRAFCFHGRLWYNTSRFYTAPFTAPTHHAKIICAETQAERPPLFCSLVLVTANNSEHHSPSVAEHVERSAVEHGGPCVGEHCELSVGEHCERSAGSVVGLALVSILCLALVSSSSAALQRFGPSLTNHFGRHSRKTLRP